MAAEIYCYDKNGNSITNLTQWDINQTISIQNIDFIYPPQFHFCNKDSSEALTVESEIVDDLIIAKVPNILLQKPTPIFVYIYAYDTDYSAKTEYVITIPVRERPKPSDYQYIENVEITSVTVIEQRVQEYITNFDISNKIITFQDISERNNISSGESLDIILGKIKKWLLDLDESAFYKVADNLTTKEDGYVLDAKQGSILYDLLKDDVTQEDIDNLFTN